MYMVLSVIPLPSVRYAIMILQISWVLGNHLNSVLCNALLTSLLWAFVCVILW